MKEKKDSIGYDHETEETYSPDSKGRITLPEWVQSYLHLKSGSKLKVPNWICEKLQLQPGSRVAVSSVYENKSFILSSMDNPPVKPYKVVKLDKIGRIRIPYSARRKMDMKAGKTWLSFMEICKDNILVVNCTEAREQYLSDIAKNEDV